MNGTAAAETSPRTPRRRITRKYIAAFVIVVGGTLLVSGGVDLFVSYRDTRRAVGELQGEKAAGAAATIERFVAGIQRQLRGAVRGAPGNAEPQTALTELRRILFQATAVEDLSFMDPAGREVARASRLAPDEVGSRADRSDSLAFRAAKTSGSFIGPVRLEHGAVPFVTMAESAVAGAIIAEVNLSIVSDVVAEIDAGKHGVAYVVDRDGRLIAHPDRTLALTGRDLSALEHVGSAKSLQASRDGLDTRGIDGSRVIASFRLASTPGWPVIVEQPTSAAVAPIRRRVGVLAALLVGGTAVAITTSVGLARRMVRPIRDLQAGAERIGAGHLDQKIVVTTGDELEALADEFNRMGARLIATLDELRASRQRLVTAQDEERRRIERNIHDGAQQELVALGIRLNLLRGMLDGEAGAIVEEVGTELMEAVGTLRELAHGIYPPRLAADGLSAALSAQRTRVPYELDVTAPSDLGRFPQAVETAVYFCCLEAMQNATKYAQATRLRIALERQRDGLAFSIADDGKGFDVATRTGGAGTQNMHDRIDALGGQLTIESTPGTGTTVTGWMPASAEEESNA